MAARRRLADTLLLNWIVTLSLLLILVGLVTFLVFFDNGIYYRGVLYPNSTFTFFWTERAR
jgi:hypothetical protein